MNHHSTHPTVQFLSGVEMSGNVIPHSWYHGLKKQNGRLQKEALLVLAEIVYWYRPEKAGKQGKTKQKFASELLQLSIGHFETKLGLTKKEVREALLFLEQRNIIQRKIQPRLQLPNGRWVFNVQYIDLLIGGLKKLMETPVPPAHHMKSAGRPSMAQRKSVDSSAVLDTGVVPIGQTNTKITDTEITKKLSSRAKKSSSPEQRGETRQKPTAKLKALQRVMSQQWGESYFANQQEQAALKRLSEQVTPAQLEAKIQKLRELQKDGGFFSKLVPSAVTLERFWLDIEIPSDARVKKLFKKSEKSYSKIGGNELAQKTHSAYSQKTSAFGDAL